MSDNYNYPEQYDVIVIGGGHAGTEAALAAARMGVKTLLITHNVDTIGQMSCNPAIGGIGKGHIVKEIDALGGVMAEAIDFAGIQFRTLNSRKGPAVRATRAQADRTLYRNEIRKKIESQENLSLFQQSIDDFILEGDALVGVVTQTGIVFRSKTFVLTAGTFLAGKIHIGDKNYSAGRAGDPSAAVLSEKLHQMPFRLGRLKTGTPPRLDKRSLDFSVMEEQAGDTPLPVFSYIGKRENHPQQVSCHITYTNATTHQIIQDSLHKSAMYSGLIDGTGPRYCPSIEDKVVRFADKDSHQIFVEPEGLHSLEIYPNGLSTSLPFESQVEYIRSIKGFENAHIVRPGYAIEYDYFDPRDLQPSLESKIISNIFLAGQINGTTGYEEAAGQGLVAGANAALKAQDKAPWVLQRNESYIGVMIDDLITLGTTEPYRMFTSRAEYRLMLREDNADMRLTEKGRQIGLVNDNRWQLFNNKWDVVAKEKARIRATWLVPGKYEPADVEPILGAIPKAEVSFYELLKRNHLQYQDIAALPNMGGLFGIDGMSDVNALSENLGLTDEVVTQVIEQLEIDARYSGYIDRQQNEIEKQKRLENSALPASYDYAQIKGLSTEVVQKLNNHQPATIAQASRISGVTPAAVSILLVHLKKRGRVESVV